MKLDERQGNKWFVWTPIFGASFHGSFYETHLHNDLLIEPKNLIYNFRFATFNYISLPLLQLFSQSMLFFSVHKLSARFMCGFWCAKNNKCYTFGHSVKTFLTKLDIGRLMIMMIITCMRIWQTCREYLINFLFWRLFLPAKSARKKMNKKLINEKKWKSRGWINLHSVVNVTSWNHWWFFSKEMKKNYTCHNEQQNCRDFDNLIYRFQTLSDILVKVTTAKLHWYRAHISSTCTWQLDQLCWFFG